MIILGIDPGLATVGFGVLETNGSNLKAVDYGILSTPKYEEFSVRLAMIEKGFNQLIEKYQPDEIAIEELFFNKNVTTAISVAHARGVIMLSAVKLTIKLFEYTPLQVKQCLTGYGRAEKSQIQHMVKTLLNLKEIPKPDDAADALAIAITHSQSRAMNILMKKT